MTFGLGADEIALMRSVFRKYPDVARVLIFGSRAIGNFKAGSDVDLALQGEIQPDTLVRIRSELENETPLPYFFDIVNYTEIAEPAFRLHIDEYGRELYVRTGQ